MERSAEGEQMHVRQQDVRVVPLPEMQGTDCTEECSRDGGDGSCDDGFVCGPLGFCKLSETSAPGVDDDEWVQDYLCGYQYVPRPLMPAPSAATTLPIARSPTLPVALLC